MAKLEHWKEMWETWDLRVVILGSLLLQTFLIFSAPLRKRSSTAYIVIPMWLAYILADVTANFAMGLISRNLGDTSGPFRNPDLVAFWAPFLLVHLGGPDTITAFALADNELWLRHFLSLGFLCSVILYAFFQSFPNKKLWLPTMLMFTVGLIKYAERTRALYLASSDRLRDSLLPEPDPGPDYAKLMDEYTSKAEAGLQTRIEMIRERSSEMRDQKDENKEDGDKLSDLKVVQCAHDFFCTFKGLISDMIFSFPERKDSRDFFLKRTPRDAFRVVEVELTFFYEVLCTKAMVVRGKLGYAFRILSFTLNCAAIGLFYWMEKNDFENIDTVITYTLLLGAIALDLVAFVMFLYSDWTVVALTKYEHPNWIVKILRKFLNVDRERWPKNHEKKPRCFSLGKIMQIVRLRWSESLSNYNLINYCLHPRSKWWQATIGIFGLTKILDRMTYVTNVDFTNELRDLIFEELKLKSVIADDFETAKEMFSARGDWILWFESCTELLHWIKEVDFDESLLLWHIATELCYNTTDEGSKHSTNPSGADNRNFRELSKLLSDHMLYLLILKNKMLSTVAGIGEIRFRDTCAEAKRFFRGRKLGKWEEGRSCCLNIFPFCECFCSDEIETGHQQSETSCCFKKCCCKGEKGPDELQIRACKSILDVDTAVEPAAVNGNRSKSVLFDACRLAKELMKLEKQRMWEIVSKVWVELLSYAASHCRANNHVAQLSKGGQLLTLVWLLMAHLGLGNQFQVREVHPRATLIEGELN